MVPGRAMSPARRPHRSAPSGRSGAWLLLLGALGLAFAGATSLAYLSLIYVPHHAAHLAELRADLPAAAAWAIGIAAWAMRLLPFLVLLVPLAVVFMVALIAIAATRVPVHRVLRVAAAAVLCAAIAEIALCGILVYGIHTAYATAPGSAQGTR